MSKPNKKASYVAGRVWCDKELHHCVMDETIAYIIATLVGIVFKNNKKVKKQKKKEEIRY